MDKIKTWIQEQLLPLLWNLLLRLTLLGIIGMWFGSALMRVGVTGAYTQMLFDAGFYATALFVVILSLLLVHSALQLLRKLRWR